MTRIDLDAERARKMLQEGTVAAGGLKNAARVPHQLAHAVDDRRRCENLA
jgi:hypothetical protein